MIQLRAPLPAFEASALSGGREVRIKGDDLKGTWHVIFFYTHDETSVCASELTSFRDQAGEFEKAGARVVAVSVDSMESHRRWQDGGFGEVPFLWISDPTKELARSFEVLHEDTGLALRGSFITDPDGWVRFASIHDLPTGRNTAEILRTLQALQTGQCTPCNWKLGEPTS